MLNAVMRTVLAAPLLHRVVSARILIIDIVGRRSGHAIVGRASREMTADVITDEDRCAVLYREILARNPVHGKYAGIRHGADGTPDLDDLRAALGRGLAVVRLT